MTSNEKEARRKRFVRREMNAKIRDAKEKYMEATKEYDRNRRFFWNDEVRRYNFNRDVNRIMHEEMVYIWQEGKRKMNKKN